MLFPGVRWNIDNSLESIPIIFGMVYNLSPRPGWDTLFPICSSDQRTDVLLCSGFVRIRFLTFFDGSGFRCCKGLQRRIGGCDPGPSGTSGPQDKRNCRDGGQHQEGSVDSGEFREMAGQNLA